MEVETLRMKMGATRPTARKYESVRADIDWIRLKRSAKTLLLEAMAEAEKVTGLRDA